MLRSTIAELTPLADEALERLLSHYQLRWPHRRITESEAICAALIGILEGIDPQPRAGDVVNWDQVYAKSKSLN